ncbi:MAG TPA: hypothetical protein VKT75_01220 [Acidobacteriaceae bacterium]|nr:hypothetical protein [Acidobacteriaceae bacterium]
MAGEEFYDVSLLRQLATNLFYGCGYNFYRIENQLRADDQLVRSKAAPLLGEAMSSVCAAESAYRRDFLPAPTRAKPFPDSEAVTNAQRLEQLARAIGAIEAALQHQPVPANDRMTQRYREEGATLKKLLGHDERLVGQCELLRTTVASQDPSAILKKLPDLEGGIAALRATLHDREMVLLNPV